MKVIIVEDESASATYLQGILEACPEDFDIPPVCKTVPEAVSAIAVQKPDLVFLDVEIRMGTGFDVLEEVKTLQFDVVFTTAFSHYAVQAFRHHAVDYLLKPLHEAQILAAVQRCRARRQDEIQNYRDQVVQLLSQMRQPGLQHMKMGVPTMEGIEFVDIPDIVYARAQGNCTELRLKTGMKVLTSRMMKEVEESLPPGLFFRVHHSYIVNLQYVQKYQKGRGGYLVLLDGSSVPVAVARKEEFLAWLG